MCSNTLMFNKDYNQLFKRFVVAPDMLTYQEYIPFFENLISNPQSAYQCAAALGIMSSRGESSQELRAFYQVMAKKVNKVDLSVEGSIDIGGTGGGNSTFNISTTASLIVAASGVPVCKHGNYRISSKSGSLDVLTCLGIDIDAFASPAYVKRVYNEVGITFLATKAYHCHSQILVDIRKSLAVPSICNLIGPLLNPANIDYQLMGVSKIDKIDTLAEILMGQGRKSFALVHGMEGIDEISPCTNTMAQIYKDGHLQSYSLTPEDFGLAPLNIDLLVGGDPNFNAKITSAILKNELPERLNVVLPTAAMALWLANAANSLPEATLLAKQTVESGKAYNLLAKIVEGL